MKKQPPALAEAVLLLLPLALILVLGVQPTTAQTPSISAYPSLLTKSGQNVTVTWANLSDPTPTDWITVHSPANQSDYIGYVALSPSETWQEGQGKWTLPLVNNRNDYGFRLWSNATGQEVLVAVSNNVTFENPREPLQGHLQLTADPSEMRLLWVSGSKQGPVVHYGTRQGDLTKSAPADSSTYSIEQLCDAPANLTVNFREPGWIHDAVLTGLEANTSYYYKFGSEEDGWSEEYRFVSSPGVGANVSIDFFVYGDMGTSFPFYIEQDQQPPAAQTTHWIRKFLKEQLDSSPSLVLHLGDISYARGLAFIWDWFFEEIEPVATRVPYMVTIGKDNLNTEPILMIMDSHEYDYPQQPFKPSWADYNTDSGGECGTPYYSRFNMPSPLYRSLLNESRVYPRNLWYSFEIGPVHFTVLSTETDFLPGSEQYEWIVEDLASVDKTRTPWLAFAGHRPMYSSSQHTGDIPLDLHLQYTYEPLFKEYGVDICFWGHVHTYERTCPMFNETCVPDGEPAPVHIIIGNAGNLYQTPWIGFPDVNSNYHLQPSWDMFRTENYGFGSVSANATHFHFTLIGDNRGQVHDRLTLTKN